MTDYFAETAQDLALHIKNFIQEKTPIYIRTSKYANNFPLDYLRLHVMQDNDNRGTYKVIVQLHKTTDIINNIGDCEFLESVGIPDFELDRFMEIYSGAQVDKKAKKGKFNDYYISQFIGSYSAMNFD